MNCPCALLTIHVHVYGMLALYTMQNTVLIVAASVTFMVATPLHFYTLMSWSSYTYSVNTLETNLNPLQVVYVYIL